MQLALSRGTYAHPAAQDPILNNATIVPKRYDGSLFLNAEPSPRKPVLHSPAGRIPCGESELELPEPFVGNTERTGIVGPNGDGTTTQLDQLRALLHLQAENRDAHALRDRATMRF